MRLYLAHVQAARGAFVKVGDHVIPEQLLGIDRDQKSAVLSPTEGVVRAILSNTSDGTLMIQILNRQEPDVFEQPRRKRPA